MASLLILTVIAVLSLSSAFSQEKQTKPLQTYIVHVSLPAGVNASQSEDLENFYHSFLPKTPKGVNDISRMVYSYRKIITGFAARLSPKEVKEMEKIDGFLSARPQESLTLKTTHTPKFLGLNPKSGFWPRSNFGEGVIIGLVDDGIKADHPSFSSDGMPPPPANWTGKCNLKGAKCNNKLIGARNFYQQSKGLPVGQGDHGTHTASTAAGNFVKGANVFGNANGTAVGIAPRAHLAMYSFCDPEGLGDCEDSAVAAAIEAAIEERVHVLSLSLGYQYSGTPRPFYNDIIAIGAFRAIEEGIFVSCAASNDGPKNSSLSNEAPWILTVGASTIDRSIKATILLGNNVEIHGESLHQPKHFTPELLPLTYAKGDIRGKIVFYAAGDQAAADIGKLGGILQNAGAAATVFMNSENEGSTITLSLTTYSFPAVQVSFAAGEAIRAYMNSTPYPVATIVFRGTVLGVKDAPEVAYFSSRGPSLASPGILKPDIIGPGVSVLAAWPYSVDNMTNTTSTFNIDDGTSMSCPHLSGIAALLRSAHRDWSTAAIKSAIMTTADTWNLNNDPILDQRQLPADVFAIGAGHANPSKAADPGLIYDIEPKDYIKYLCGLGYTDANISIILNHPVNCSSVEKIPEAQLNYPSFAVQLGATTETYTRTVTNVGKAPSTYRVAVELIPGVDVHVEPLTLKFRELKEKQTYRISFRRSSMAVNESYVQGAITWVFKTYIVRSPISIKLV